MPRMCAQGAPRVAGAGSVERSEPDASDDKALASRRRLCRRGRADFV